MNIDELRAALQAILDRQEGDCFPDDDHKDADTALLAYINDAEVTRIFDAIERWYA